MGGGGRSVPAPGPDVALNKGPHILDAVDLLDRILRRMQAHQHEKRAMLRRLHWWTRVQKRMEAWKAGR